MKDPALLWYFNDWSGGTTIMSRHLKGCYMDLLAAQFNSGPMSLEEIKTVLGSDFGSSWPTIQKKFKCENGLYFNERLQNERDKRVNYSESRRKNRISYVPHMENENRNENTNTTELPIWLNLPAWNALVQHRKEIKKPLTSGAKKLIIKKLEANKEDQVQMIKNAIENGWRTVFPLKKGDERIKASIGRYQKQEDTAERQETKEEQERRKILLTQADLLAKNMVAS